MDEGARGWKGVVEITGKRAVSVAARPRQLWEQRGQGSAWASGRTAAPATATSCTTLRTTTTTLSTNTRWDHQRREWGQLSLRFQTGHRESFAVHL